MLILILPRKRILKRSRKVTECPESIIQDKESAYATNVLVSSTNVIVLEANVPTQLK